jgi:hypothetical protein
MHQARRRERLGDRSQVSCPLLGGCAWFPPWSQLVAMSGGEGGLLAGAPPVVSATMGPGQMGGCRVRRESTRSHDPLRAPSS